MYGCLSMSLFFFSSLGSSIDNRNLDLFFSCSAVGIPFDNGRTKKEEINEGLGRGLPSSLPLSFYLYNR